MEALAAQEKNLVQLPQRIDGLTTRFNALFDQADDLTKRQLALNSLHERLAEVEELSKRTVLQLDSLTRSRRDLDALRQDIQDFYTSHAEAVKLRDKLGVDRAALENFDGRVTALMASTPELEAAMDAILGKMTLVAEGTRAAESLSDVVANLDAQMSRVSARVPIVDTLELRLNGLHEVSTDVDQAPGAARGVRNSSA